MSNFTFKTVGVDAVTQVPTSRAGRAPNPIKAAITEAMAGLEVGKSLPIPLTPEGAPKGHPTGVDISPNAKDDDGRATAIRMAMNASKKALAQTHPELQFSRIVTRDVKFSKNGEPVSCVLVSRLEDISDTIHGENATQPETENA